MLFAWRSRPNCHNCYNMGLWEFVGLFEHHPDIFEWNEQFEREIASGDRRENAFYIKKDWPLSRIRAEKEVIKRRRCKKICQTIYKRAKVTLPFDDEQDDDEMDVLDFTPCGLFCGK